MNKKIFKIIFILIILLSGGYFVYDYIEAQKLPEIFQETSSTIHVAESEKKVITLENSLGIKLSPDIDLAATRRKYNNNDIVGRLEIPELFNILIVQGKDNQYYLGRDTSRKNDFRGSEFLDYRNGLNDQRINIYGHNSRDKKIKVPFQKIEIFSQKKYFDENPYFVFQSDIGREYYKIMAIKNVTTDREHLSIDSTGVSFLSHMERLLKNTKNSRNVPYDENSKIMVLQTCAYNPDNSYDLLIAQKLVVN